MDETYHETLKWINRLRRKHGKGGLKKIRKGRHSCFNCPVRNSLSDVFPNLRVSTKLAFYGKPYTINLDLPDYVLKFIEDFDYKKKYQELWTP